MKKQLIEMVMDNLIMRGISNTGENDECVIMFHGFTGNKSETNRIFYKIDNLLEKNNISSIRFDWYGHGESDLDLSILTMNLLLKQASQIIEDAKKRFKKIYLLGFSMGGAIAINMLHFLPEKLILISPATNMVELIKNMFDVRDKIEGGFIDLNGSKLNRKFLESCKILEYKEKLSAYDKPVLLIHGTCDMAVPISYSCDLKTYIKVGKFLEVEGADHGYSKIEFMNSVFSSILDFLKES
ncbi:MAG: alpha/beta hydrolase [Candidatus Izemoplasmatales bacterium]